MSTYEVSKVSPLNESNIPVPKRMLAGAKKSKGCPQLPELQKYIETIIKASNECESDNTSQSDKDKFPKERKFSRNSLNKGSGSKVKLDSVKFDSKINRSKSNTKAKTPTSEAVSSGVKQFFSSYFPEFEDPRSWKFNKTKNSQPKIKVENFLKKVFPNPYDISSISTKKKEDLKDVTLRDIVISILNKQSGGNIAKSNKDSVIADIKSCKRETAGKNVSSDPSLEKCNKSQPHNNNKLTTTTNSNNNNNNNNNNEKSKGSQSSTAQPKKECPKSYKTHKSHRLLSSNSTSFTSSRGSSLESVNELIRKQSVLDIKERKTLGEKTEKENLIKLSKVKVNESISDYDIGKLKLLNSTDSEDTMTSKSQQRNIKNKSSDDIVNEECSETTSDVYKSNDLNELREIYDVINKATESFLFMSAKTNSSEVSTNTDRNKFVEYLNELNSRDAEVQKREDEELKNKINILNNEDTPQKGTVIEETEYAENLTKSADKNIVEMNSVEETNSVSLLNILLKDDNFKFQSQSEDLQVNEQVDDLLQKSESADVVDDSHQVDDQSRKIDEVLEFMYDCLKNISCRKKENAENDPPPEDTKTKKIALLKKFRKESTTDIKPSVSQIPKTMRRFPTNQIDSLSGKNTFRVRPSQTESRKHPTRVRYRRRPEIFSTFQFADRKTLAHETPVSTISVVRSFVHPITYREAHEPIISSILTAESQNELGGYTEDTFGIDEDLRITKSIIPLSAKLKRSGTDSRRTLKDALENEEKFLTEIEPEEDDNKNLITFNTSHSMIRNESANEIDVPPCPSSNFIICLNSCNRNFRISPSIPLPLAISLNDVEQAWNFGPLRNYPKYASDKLTLPRAHVHQVFKISYNVKQEILVTGNQSVVEYTVMPVCLKVVVELPKQEEVLSLENTKCSITIQIKPPRREESYDPEPSSPPKQSSSIESEEEEVSEKPVKALIEAIEEAEEKVSLLEQGNSSLENIIRYTQLLPGPNDLKNEALNKEKDSEKKKIHELLLRTCNVQQKLQQFLHKITTAPPSCPLTETDLDEKPKSALPLVHWHLFPSESKSESKIDEFTNTTVQMVDSGTSYEPPVHKSSSSNYEPEQERKHDNESFAQNDDDDNSSTYSFKSSNDFSEASETQNVKKESVDVVSTKILKKILHDIKLFKQSFEEEKLATQNQQKDGSISKNPETSTENRLVEYDPKTPAKVLRTVFKGTKSSTELTIGLKDVPMTKVSNIAVEKTKLSPNHTKISICILKDNSDELLQLSNQVPHRNLSSYLFDRIRPSLSSCFTEYSHINDDASKSSESVNKDSDNDEDDYKSVGSTLDNSDSDSEEKKKSKEEKNVEENPPKNYTKHKFDFYKKMSPDIDSNRTRQRSLPNSICRYHELEPIKQALTEMQIRMRSIKRDAMFSSNDYYERALKLAKMSAGYCQSCGNRAVIPNDTFGYYKTLLPRRCTQTRRNHSFKMNLTPSPSFYSFHSTNPELNNHICDLDIKRSTSYLLNRSTHSNRTILRSSLHDMPVLLEECKFSKN